MAVPRGDDWLHEPKLDGYRFQIVKDGAVLRLYSRRGYDWTMRS
jgi:bifunctional non-homologous end joining protein LigD